MFKSDSLKSFIISRIFGLISLTIAIFLFLSLISFNENDITFGNINSSLKTLNYLGIYGAHISGFLLVALHYSSYLIPIFSGLREARICPPIIWSTPSIAPASIMTTAPPGAISSAG